MNRQVFRVFLLIFAIGCGGVDRGTFATVDQASRAVQAAVESKAGLLQYREVLKAYSDRVLVTRPSAKNVANRVVLADYEEALKELTDIQLVWEASDARGSDMLPVSDPLPARVAREYQLGINTNEPPSIYANEAMHTIWEAALQHLRHARLEAGFTP